MHAFLKKALDRVESFVNKLVPLEALERVKLEIKIIVSFGLCVCVCACAYVPTFIVAAAIFMSITFVDSCQ